MTAPVLFYAINVDWYLKLHWEKRILSSIKRGYQPVVSCVWTDLSYKDYLTSLGVVCHQVHLSRRGLNPLSELSSFFEIFFLFDLDLTLVFLWFDIKAYHLLLLFSSKYHIVSLIILMNL